MSRWGEKVHSRGIGAASENMYGLFQRWEREYQIRGQFNYLTTTTTTHHSAIIFTSFTFFQGTEMLIYASGLLHTCGKYDHRNRILKILCCLQIMCYRKERGGVFTNRRKITTICQCQDLFYT